MKTVISSTGNQLTSAFDLRFGRCRYFCVFDPSKNDAQFIKNNFSDDKDCVGDKVAELIHSLGAEKVISGDFGNRIIEYLNNYDIQMVILKDNSRSIGEILSLLNDR